MKSAIILLFAGFFAVFATSRHVIIETVDVETLGDEGIDVGNKGNIDFCLIIIFLNFINGT